jgi:hypothetical protein
MPLITATLTVKNTVSFNTVQPWYELALSTLYPYSLINKTTQLNNLQFFPFVLYALRILVFLYYLTRKLPNNKCVLTLGDVVFDTNRHIQTHHLKWD